MSKINNYYQKKQLMEKLMDELSALESDTALKQDLRFEEQVKELMEENEKTARDVLEILSVIDPSIGSLEYSPETTTRAKRPLRVYKNPHTDEIVETRGGNHKVLNEWREKWGKEDVQSWVQE